jgi:hypothetical protein
MQNRLEIALIAIVWGTFETSEVWYVLGVL